MKLPKSNKATWPSLTVFFASFTVLASLMFFIDDTTYLTGNGVYKSLAFLDYMHSPDRDHWKGHLDEWKANFLYIPVGSFLIEYGMGFLNISIVKKITLLNVLFAALALTFFYRLIMALFKNPTTAAVATFFHLACGMFFIMATISEDIMPAYAMLMGAILFFVIYLEKRQLRSLLIASTFFLLSWLFHWTMILAGASFGLALLLVKQSLRKKAMSIAGFAMVQVVGVGIAALFAGVGYFELWLPGKGTDNGWFGFSLAKLMDEILFKPVYVSGYDATSDFAYGSFFSQEDKSNVLFYFFSIVIIITGLYYFIKQLPKNGRKVPFPFFAFLACAFVTGSLLGVMDQADGQYEMLPMIIVPVSFALFIDAHKRNKFITGAKAIIPIALLLYCLHTRLKTQGTDTLNWQTVEEIMQVAGTNDEAFFILEGNDNFTVWSDVVNYEKGPYTTLTMNQVLEWHHRETDEQVVRFLDSFIVAEMKLGKRIIKGPNMDRNLEHLQTTFSRFQQPGKVELMYNYMRENFTQDSILNTYYGNYYLLQPSERLNTMSTTVSIQ